MSGEPQDGTGAARRALSFGAVAEQYDRWRPGYPDAVYEHLIELGRAGRVLEVGAGTGKATVDLAERASSVVAIEPDPAMATVLRGRVGHLPVDVREGKFEDTPVPAGAFDLLVSAQAWHWVDPHRGPVLARNALKTNGVIGLLFNRPASLTGPIWDRINAIYEEQAPGLDRRAHLTIQPERERTFPALPGFTSWKLRYFDWTATYDAHSYVHLVATHSDHSALAESTRAVVLGAIRRAIEAEGGRFDYNYRTVLLAARRDS